MTVKFPPLGVTQAPTVMAGPSDDTMAIALGVVAAVLLVIVIILLVYICRRSVVVCLSMDSPLVDVLTYPALSLEMKDTVSTFSLALSLQMKDTVSTFSLALSYPIKDTVSTISFALSHPMKGTGSRSLLLCLIQ